MAVPRMGRGIWGCNKIKRERCTTYHIFQSLIWRLELRGKCSSHNRCDTTQDPVEPRCRGSPGFHCRVGGGYKWALPTGATLNLFANPQVSSHFLFFSKNHLVFQTEKVNVIRILFLMNSHYLRIQILQENFFDKSNKDLN